LARVWLEENVPCSVAKYYEEVLPIMPIHINYCRGLKNKTRLAGEALQRNQAKIEDGMIVDFKRQTVRCRWPGIAQGMNEVDISSFGFSRKEKDAFRKWLAAHDYKVVAPNKYKLT